MLLVLIVLHLCVRYTPLQGSVLIGVSFEPALTPVHDVLRLALWSFVVTTATMVSQARIRRIMALLFDFSTMFVTKKLSYRFCLKSDNLFF